MQDSYSPGLMTFGTIFCVALFRLPFPWTFLGLGCVVFLLRAQRTFNGCWHVKQQNMPVRTALNAAEITIIVIGGILLLLSFVAVFMPGV